MTTTGYGPPPVRTSGPSAAKVLTALMAFVGPPVSLVVGFLGLIEWSGCFIGCSSASPNHALGGLLVALAIALFLAAPVMAATWVRSGVWVVGTLAVPVVGGLLVAGRLGW